MYCTCMCNTHTYFKGLTQVQILEFLIAETKIDPKSTHAAQNKLISKTDDRKSSAIIGLVGIVVLSSVFGLIFISDVINFVVYINQRYKCKLNKTN